MPNLLTNILSCLIAVLLIIPSTVLFIECSAALFEHRSTTKDRIIPRPTVAVLIPAHNEASGISATLKTLMPQLTKSDRVVVIADNCNDETAAVARRFGVTVLERLDPYRKGKGYALDYGMQFLQAEPSEVVIVIDADCIVHKGTIEQIARQAAASGQPVQATYIMEQPANPTTKDVLSALAVMVKNIVRPTGLKQLGLPSLLAGSGMAFPWSAISKVSLANSKTVDDIQLTLDLTVAGYAPIYCQQAQVTGRLMEQEAALSQRARWEHGHLEIILTQVPLLLKASISEKRLDLLAIAFDLCVPPLSLLVMFWLTGATGALLATAMGGSWSPAIVLLAMEGLMIFISIFAAWARFCRGYISGLTFLAVPFYILWKIPLYLQYIVKPQTQWLWTERDRVAQMK